MIQLSRDPTVAERQIEAIIFYLTTCGYIDSEFDLREKAFVRAYLRKLVTARVDGQGDLSPEARFEQIERLHEHYVEMFQTIDGEVAELFTEVTTEEEDTDAFVWSRLKLRCFELFKSLDDSNRGALLEVVDEFINADGVVHPAEVKFRNELADLLGREIMIDEAEIEGVGVEVSKPGKLEARQVNHPFFESHEHHYSSKPELIRKQIDADLKVVEQAEAKFLEQKAEGKGKLAGKKTVSELEPGRYLDEHVYCVAQPEGDYELVVLGDLHGCYSCLKAAVLQSDFMEKVKRHRLDPENNPAVYLVLLGDYIDRGRFSYNGVLRTVLKLFVTVPDNVFVLRGNHEYYIEYQGRIYGGVKPADAINSLSPLLPNDVFERYLAFFDTMPTSLLFDTNLFVHAGIPRDSLIRDRWEGLDSLNDPDVRFQMMWSDPSRADVIPDDLQESSARFPFGRVQFRNFMAQIGCNLLVRGHEKVNAGFRNNYDDDDVRLLTLFSAGGVANDDIPLDSNYRDVRPMALTVRRTDGEVKVTPWEIDYRKYQDPELNAFFRKAIEVDIGKKK